MSTYSRPSTYLPPRPAVPVALRPQAPAAARPATPAPKPAVPVREERPAPPPPLDRMRGRQAKLTLSNGDSLTGVVVEVHRYEILLRPEVGKLVVAMKAHVVLVEEVEP